MEKRTIIILAVIGIIVVFVLTLIVGAIRKPSTNPVDKVANKALIRVEDVVAEPLVFDGLDIEVEANVSTWVNKKSFFVGVGGGPFGGSTDLLVIYKENFPLPKDAATHELGLGEKLRVHVIGRARIVNREKLEELLGIDLDSEEAPITNLGFSNWGEQIVILATNVDKP